MSAFDTLAASALTDASLARLKRLVTLESPSDDEARLRALAGELVSELVGLGGEVETENVPGVGEHVVARLPGADPGQAPLLLLGHMDTVHPTGVFDPVFRQKGGRAYGPGVFDMKGGWACALEALWRLNAAGAGPRRPLVILATCDEETGSMHSRDLIERLARGAHAALVPEPPLPDGAVKTRRKGVGWYRVTVTGRASHAGLAPEAGVNAVVELARLVERIAVLSDPELGTTVTPTTIEGGTARNVVPAEAALSVDVRFTSRSEGERLEGALRSLAATGAAAGVLVSGGINRRPLERTEGVAALYERARALAAESGYQLGEGLAGGASDGSLVAALGVPVLDGIGPRGGGAHALDEHVEVADLGPRVALYGRLFETL